MRELQKTDPAQYDKALTESRRAASEYARQYGQYDAEAIAAVDKFRSDKGLDYQGNPAGLVDERLIEALRAAYIQKRRAAAPK